MKKIIGFLKEKYPFIHQFIVFIAVEFLLILSYIFLLNNYLGHSPTTINADAKGYYDYLPSIFIHKDINRKNFEEQWNPEKYTRINELGVYVPYKGLKVNKYPCGTAILQFPFFTWTYLTHTLEKNNNDGYQIHFQKTIYRATLFYLFLSLILLKLLLNFYSINLTIIYLCQFFLIFSTSITHYAAADAGFSHVYSMFAILLFCYYFKKYIETHQLIHFIFICIALSLIILLRNINILIILFIPFLIGSLETLKSEFKFIISKFKWLIVGFIVSFSFISIQLLLWYLQTGVFWVYSYQGEGFNFFQPHFFDILFSYKKGLFVYTPILLLTMMGVAGLLFSRQYFLFASWLTFFIILTYILSSWWSWFYGCSYGLRAYIDFYPLFFIPFAMFLQSISLAKRAVIFIISFITVPINIIQTYQYSVYILHWIEMDQDKYWKVFLKTDNRYRGILWKQKPNENDLILEKEVKIMPFSINAGEDKVILEEKIDVKNKISNFALESEDNFDVNEDAKITIITESPSKQQGYWYEFYFLHLLESDYNQKQKGVYFLNTHSIADSSTVKITFHAGKQAKKINYAKLKIYSKK